jgi:hypothetical protein
MKQPPYAPNYQKQCLINDCGIERKELALEPKPALAEVQLPALAQKLIKNLLVELPWPMFEADLGFRT